jgi:uncharacterized protein YcfJ
VPRFSTTNSVLGAADPPSEGEADGLAVGKGVGSVVGKVVGSVVGKFVVAVVGKVVGPADGGLADGDADDASLAWACSSYSFMKSMYT